MVLFENINRVININSIGYNGRRRRLFIPPSTRHPLFIYGNGEDQRSFLSLCSGSAYETNDNQSDVASVSTSRSLPSTLDSIHTDPDQMTWLLEEQERRYESERSASRSSEDNGSSHGTSIASTFEDLGTVKTNLCAEAKILSKYALPLIVTFLLEQIFSVVSVLVVGRIGKNELAAVSLASMTSTITLAVFEGVSTALDTLCPQSYGAGSFYDVGEHVQRCSAFSLVLFIPFAFLWYYSHLFFQFIIEDPEVVQLTTLFLRVLIIGAPAYILFENIKRFLQAQGIFEASTCILIITAPINVLMSWYLVWDKKYGLGFIGAPIAASINFWFMLILLVLYIFNIDGKRCWGGFTGDAFKHWGELSKLAIPGIVMLESEYLAYEILTLFASYFGTAELAAQSAVSTIASLTYMLPFAVSIASATRIANYIGAGNIFSAKVATKVGLYTSLLVSFLNSVVLFVFRRQIARMFSKDSEVVILIVELFPLVAFLQLFDGLSSVASGILRAQGKQHIGGIINLVAYYLFAIPLSIVLSWYCDLQLFGLWIGIGLGMVSIGLSETYFILSADWDKIVDDAMLRNKPNESS